jgi:hypothetical protein
MSAIYSISSHGKARPLARALSGRKRRRWSCASCSITRATWRLSMHRSMAQALRYYDDVEITDNPAADLLD